MKDLVNEGRHLQDNFKDRLKESPMDKPIGPSKADEHYKINHPVLTIVKIEDDKRGYSSNRGTTYTNITFGYKDGGTMSMANLEGLLRDASNIARDLCKKWDDYNTDNYAGKAKAVGDTIVVPVRVEHWTGD